MDGRRSFDCVRCGACCRLVSFIGELAHLDRGDGACVHLRGAPGDEHACAIYDARPRICRVDAMTPPTMPLEHWIALNEAACSGLHERAYGSPLVRPASLLRKMGER
jgi:Fe-S-cluster containining protein